MKEPFIALAGVTALVASSGAVSDPALADRIGAVLATGTCSALYSWWKSRKRNADRTDTVIWALISLLGSMSLAWIFGPVLADREALGIVTPGVPPMTWLLGMSAAPIIEWLLDSRAFKVVLKKLGIEAEAAE